MSVYLRLGYFLRINCYYMVTGNRSSVCLNIVSYVQSSHSNQLNLKQKLYQQLPINLKMTRKEDENKFSCSFFPSFKQNKNFIVPDFLALFSELDGNSLKPFLSWPFKKTFFFDYNMWVTKGTYKSLCKPFLMYFIVALGCGFWCSRNIMFG